MKNKIIYLTLAACTLGVMGCTEKESGVIPSGISNVRSEERPGGIFLHWDMPADSSALYVRVSYHDPLLKKEVSRLSSCDTILLPDTRQKYGEYTILLQPFSPTDMGGLTESITAVSGKAPETRVASQLILKAGDLSTNAQEPSEGPIAGLLDGNMDTYFHTAWSVDIPAPHWMAVKLPQEMKEYYRFYYAPRQNGNNKPTDFDLMGSTDGQTWFLIRNFTKEADKLPVTSAEAYTSPDFKVEKPFSYVKLVVNKTNSSSVFWTMSEFKIYTVTVVDPEAPDVSD